MYTLYCIYVYMCTPQRNTFKIRCWITFAGENPLSLSQDNVPVCTWCVIIYILRCSGTGRRYLNGVKKKKEGKKQQQHKRRLPFILLLNGFWIRWIYIHKSIMCERTQCYSFALPTLYIYIYAYTAAIIIIRYILFLITKLFWNS